MKFAAVLFLLIAHTTFGQETTEDSIYIEFLRDNVRFPEYLTIYCANGKYSVKPQELNKLKIPGTIQVNPTQLTFNKGLQTAGNSSLMQKFGSYSYSPDDYLEVSRDYVDSIIAWHESNGKQLTREEIYTLHGIREDKISEIEKLRIEARYEAEERERDRVRDSTYKVKKKLDPTFRTPHEQCPGCGILSGAWIHPPYYYQKASFTDYIHAIQDSISATHQLIRSTKIQPLIDSILQPFYFSQTEVTNKEYREFVRWVQDSIARDLLYFG